MQKIRAAVVGVGYLGRFHAQKYAQLSGCELVGVVDSNRDTREQVAAELGTAAFEDHRALTGSCPAVGTPGRLRMRVRIFCCRSSDR